MDNNLDNSNNESKDAYSLLEITYQRLAEFLTGVLTSGKKDWALSIGFLFQRFRGGHFLKQLNEEIKKYIEKGKIKDDYLKTEQCKSCLQEFLDCLDKDSPDEQRFKAMKAIFLTIATEDKSNRDEIIPYQLMRICRKLSSSELLVLLATYDIYASGKWEADKNEKTQRGLDGTTEDWVNKVIERSGLKFRELVILDQESLVLKKLLSPNVNGDKSGFKYTDYYRFTPLGYELCSFIKEYELENEQES